MKEEIRRLLADDEIPSDPCGQCHNPLVAGDEIVRCPRCKQIHHLKCWVARGGCARHGCRQVMSASLRPPKEEHPIVVKKTPPWIIWTIIAACVGIAIGLYYNGQRVKQEREQSAYVLVPADEDQALWERIAKEFNQTPTGNEHPVHLVITPPGPEGSLYEQKLLIMMAAKDAPEFVLLEADRVPLYTEMGALSSLDDIVAELRAQGLPIAEDRLAHATYEGTIYGIPHPSRDAYFVLPVQARNPELAPPVFLFVIPSLYEMIAAD